MATSGAIHIALATATATMTAAATATSQMNGFHAHSLQLQQRQNKFEKKNAVAVGTCECTLNAGLSGANISAVNMCFVVKKNFTEINEAQDRVRSKSYVQYPDIPGRKTFSMFSWFTIRYQNTIPDGRTPVYWCLTDRLFIIIK